MAITTTYTKLRTHLASFLDLVGNGQRIVIVKHRGTKDVALLPAKDLSGLLETLHLLRSHKNARRLLTALNRATRVKRKKR
ncbi:MAG: prevent-host-death protein [Acidobacteria bacterium]|nr:MAG: prevent-host-death protein [Acidobacteriota bacterium]PYY13483.1 MAG: prevent-host-death protein [Acidobacteriota bacterium]